MIELKVILDYIIVPVILLIGWLFKKLNSLTDRITRIEVNQERDAKLLEDRRQDIVKLYDKLENK